MHTENEAKERWCPFSRVATGYAGVNRAGSFPHGGSQCIASACMAWRAEMESYTPQGGDPLANPKWQPKRATGRGYCGLAGRIE